MQLSLTKDIYMPDYDAEKVKCIDFLTAFTDPSIQEDPIHGKHKYLILMVGHYCCIKYKAKSGKQGG